MPEAIGSAGNRRLFLDFEAPADPDDGAVADIYFEHRGRKYFLLRLLGPDRATARAWALEWYEESGAHLDWYVKRVTTK